MRDIENSYHQAENDQCRQETAVVRLPDAANDGDDVSSDKRPGTSYAKRSLMQFNPSLQPEHIFRHQASPALFKRTVNFEYWSTVPRCPVLQQAFRGRSLR
jgi:hypothetical protein